MYKKKKSLVSWVWWVQEVVEFREDNLWSRRTFSGLLLQQINNLADIKILVTPWNHAQETRRATMRARLLLLPVQISNKYKYYAKIIFSLQTINRSLSVFIHKSPTRQTPAPEITPTDFLEISENWIYVVKSGYACHCRLQKFLKKYTCSSLCFFI